MKTIAIDMDGTLLHEDGYVTKENASALKKLQEKGDKVVIATGRGMPDVQRLLNEVNVKPDGIISLNGAIVSWGEDIIRDVHMIREDAVALMHWLDEQQIYYHAYTNKGIYTPPQSSDYFRSDLDAFTSGLDNGDEVNEKIWKVAEGHRRKSKMKELPEPEFIEENQITVYKFLILSMLGDKLQNCRSNWEDAESIHITSSGRDNLEIMHPSTQKGIGLMHLTEHAGLSMDKTFAIGDNFNDLPMFEKAATSIAMGNAEPEVKKAATFETTHHNESGVAHAIETFVLNAPAGSSLT